ncbi:reverse transcriptase domain-containing protein [Tanacetum coccineum]
MACHDGPTGRHHGANNTAKKDHSRLHEETSIYSWPSIICQNGLKQRRSPLMTPELFANFSNLSSPDLELPVPSLVIAVPIFAMTNFQRTIGENRASWSDKLDDTLWAFRTAFKTPIGYTPYKLVYGKACHLPIELEHKAYWALKYCNYDLKTVGDHRKVQLNELNELRDQAYENSLIYKKRTKRLHDSKIKNRVFNVGDRVLLFNYRLKIFSGKLKTRWTGPFTVAQVFPYGTVELSSTNGPNFKETDIKEKDTKRSQKNKIEHGTGKSVKGLTCSSCRESSCKLESEFRPPINAAVQKVLKPPLALPSKVCWNTRYHTGMGHSPEFTAYEKRLRWSSVSVAPSYNLMFADILNSRPANSIILRVKGVFTASLKGFFRSASTTVPVTTV